MVPKLYLEYIKLTNYDWFLTGMDKREIEVEFTRDDNFIVLTGDNGTGKSSFTRLANTPFPRTSNGYGIIPGKGGQKLQIYNDEIRRCKWKVVHNFNPDGDSHTCDSHLYRIIDGDEEPLNPGGGVRSFYDKIEEYFGLNRYNSEVLYMHAKEDLGIVEKTPAERRKFIRKIVEGLDKIDTKLKVVDKKYKSQNREKKANEVKLSNYSDTEKLENQLEDLREIIKNYRTQLKGIQRKIGSIDSIEDSYIEDIKKDIECLHTENQTIDMCIELLCELDVEDSLQYYIDNLEFNKRSIKKELESIEMDLNKINKNILKLNKEVSSLDDLKENDTYYKSLQKRISNVDQDIKELDPIFNQDDIDTLEDGIYTLIHRLETVYNNLSNYNMLNDKLNEDNIDSNGVKLNKRLVSLKDGYKDKCSELEKISDKYNILPDGLHPHGECNHVKCPMKVYHDNHTENNECIGEIQKHLSKIEEDISVIEEDIRVYDNDKYWLNEFLNVKDILITLKDILCKSEVTGIFLNDELYDIVESGHFNKVRNNIKLLIEEHKKYYKYYTDKKKLSNMELMGEKETRLYNRYTSELCDIKKRRECVIVDKKEHIKDLESVEKEIDNVKGKIDNRSIRNMNVPALDDFKKDNSDDIKSLKKELSELNKKRKKRKELEKEEKKLEDTLTKNNAMLADVNKELNIVEHLEDEYEKLIKEVRFSHSVREVLRIYLPMKVMDSFLEKVKIESNRLLQSTNLPYRIADFELTDKIFRIEFIKRENRYDDISQTSTGESTVISAIILFGEIEALEKIKDYRIMVLDEVDGFLKEGKKAVFKELLKDRLKQGKISQLFMCTQDEKFTKMNDVSHICFTKSKVKRNSGKRILYHHAQS